MKQLPNIASMLYAQPWAILPEAHAELGRLYRSYVTGKLPEPVALESREYISSGIQYEFDAASGIMVVHISGIIAKRAPDIMCGPQIADLARLDELIDEAAGDDAVKTVILNLNSPGGSVVGLDETTASLRELAEDKRLIAYTDFQACSAAYWIACAADEIYASPSAIIASIGSYIAGVDDSRAWEMEGLELKLARSGTLKALGHPGKQWTEEEMKFLAETNDQCGADFRAWVESRRGAISENAMQGQWLFAKDPLASGLTDGFHRNLSALIGQLMSDEI